VSEPTQGRALLVAILDVDTGSVDSRVFTPETKLPWLPRSSRPLSVCSFSSE